MKTTEEMHQKYYDKLYEQTGLTPEVLDYFDVDSYRHKINEFNRRSLSDYELRVFNNNTRVVVFATNEEQRVNKKWKKRNERNLL